MREILPDGVPIEAACLYHAIAARMILGEECKIVAGSSSWKFTNFDNGRNPTHFTYEYTNSLNFPESSMPEIHIWNEYKGKVLDLSTRYLPDQIENFLGYTFEENLIPPLFHHGEKEGGSGQWLYKEIKEATNLANRMVQDAMIGIIAKNSNCIIKFV